jgi:hypothetical protein
MKRFTLILICLCGGFLTHGQEKCGVNDAYFNAQKNQSTKFENWIRATKIGRSSNVVLSKNSTLYQIPVVVHIVHNGDEIGTGTNLGDLRIQEQIDILNKDFRRTTKDTLLTPLRFLPVAADTQIEFVLAKRDPEGLPTTGIVRVQGSQNGYRVSEIESISDDRLLKAESNWPPDEYLNIYVTDLLNGFLGYAKFPFVELEGIDDPNGEAALDGAVVDYQYFGLNSNTGGSFESFGRTLTHEVGHYFGLRHVWGDSQNCTFDDFCEDTPSQSESYNRQCPSDEPQSCDSEDMFSNYMNYTNDACMNIFSTCQRERMRFVIENASRVKELPTSRALLDPIVTQNDLGVRRILSPTSSICNNEVYPVIEVRNYGKNTIANASVRLYIDGLEIETANVNTEIQSLQTAIVNFSPRRITSNEGFQMRFEILTVNDTLDNNSENNEKTVLVDALIESFLPYFNSFNDGQSLASRTDIPAGADWQVVTAPFYTSNNQAASVTFNNSSYLGDEAYLLSPLFDLSALSSAELSFYYSYSILDQINTEDALQVVISKDCGATFLPEDIIFQRTGRDLITAPTFPRTPDDWEQVELNITPYAGNPNIRIAWIAQHGAKGQLIVDSISVASTSLKARDIGIRSVNNLPVVTCASSIIPGVNVRNYGFQTINSFDVRYSYQNESNTLTFTDLNIPSGGEELVNLPISRLEDGRYEFEIEVLNPNMGVDELEPNNSFNYEVVIDNESLSLPSKVDFETAHEWINSNPKGESLWSNTETVNNSWITANGFSNSQLTSEHWFVSPLLLTNSLDSLSMQFDYAYKARGGFNDRLQILLSSNCGNDFTTTLFDQTSDQLTDELSFVQFIPQEANDWQKVFIDLTDYVDLFQLRIAFVFTNGNGNDLHIDNVQFYQTSNQNLVRSVEPYIIYPNPATDFVSVALNLPNKSLLKLVMTDMSGRIVRNQLIDNAINQNIRIETQDLKGFYILHLSTKDIQVSKRIFIRD